MGRLPNENPATLNRKRRSVTGKVGGQVHPRARRRQRERVRRVIKKGRTRRKRRKRRH